MLKSPTKVVLNKGNDGSKSYQYILFNDLVKRNQDYQNVVGIKDRSQRSAPDMQQIIRADMKRLKTNKIYDRKLNQDLNGPKGLNWQHKQELQRLQSDERGVERDLIRLNRDLAKMSSLHSIIRSPRSMPGDQISRLSSIPEENSYLPMIEKRKSVVARSSSINSNRTFLKHFIPIQKRSAMIKTNPYNEQSHSLPRYSLQQLIAKTSDDRSYLQQHAHTMNQQKRLIEQKLKKFSN